MKSLAADTAATAGSAITADNALQLGGVSAGQYVVTTDPRLTDARSPTAGSADYIQNGTTQQTSSNFNISGTGKAGVFDAASQFNIGGARILYGSGTNVFAGKQAGLSYSSGDDNTYFGDSAGRDNSNANWNSFFGTNAGRQTTTGCCNSFFGRNAGEANTLGVQNSFFGMLAGRVNTTGDHNAFFGDLSGQSNTTADDNAFFGSFSGFGNTTGARNTYLGSQSGYANTIGTLNTFVGNQSGYATTIGGGNTFVGNEAGDNNITGSENTVLGANADVIGPDLTYATAIGAGAKVSTSNTVQLGRTDGSDTVLIPGNLTLTGSFTGSLPVGSLNYIQNRTTQQGSSNFNVQGFGKAFLFDALTEYRLGGTTVFSLPGLNNTYVGSGAGLPSAGTENSFFGKNAGNSITSGSGNSFFGAFSGSLNTSGTRNSFFGVQAGESTADTYDNSYFGYRAGKNSDGYYNSFFGSQAGENITSGYHNSFFGFQAGRSTTSFDNTFVGSKTGVENVSGYRNSFVGSEAGQLNTTGSDNSFFGFASGKSNTVGLGNSFFGYGTGVSNTSGNTNSFFGYLAGSANTTASNNAFFGANAGTANTTGVDNSFFGSGAGENNSTIATDSGNNNTFIGRDSGNGNTIGIRNTAIGAYSFVLNQTGNANTIVGRSAGYNAVGNDNSFFGVFSGSETTTGIRNTFYGRNSGNANVTGSNNTALGYNSDVGATNLTYATAIGSDAIVSASNTIQLGRTNGSDKIVVPGLGSAGATSLCRNASSQISTCSSSVRYKDNIDSFSPGFELIRRLRPVSFNWKDGGMLDLGLVAEEVAAVEPLLTTTNANGQVEGVKYDRVGVVLINVVKEQQVEIERLKRQVEQLNELKAAVCELKPETQRLSVAPIPEIDAMKKNVIGRTAILIAITISLASGAIAQSTAFTFQGSLQDNGAAANGQLRLRVPALRSAERRKPARSCSGRQHSLGLGRIIHRDS